MMKGPNWQGRPGCCCACRRRMSARLECRPKEKGKDYGFASHYSMMKMSMGGAKDLWAKYDKDHFAIQRLVEDAFSIIDAEQDNREMWRQYGSGPWPYDLAQIKCPTMIWHGDLDPIEVYAHGEFNASLVPNAELIKLEGHGHLTVSLEL